MSKNRKLALVKICFCTLYALRFVQNSTLLGFQVGTSIQTIFSHFDLFSCKSKHNLAHPRPTKFSSDNRPPDLWWICHWYWGGEKNPYLNHVVSLRPKACDMAINVDRFFIFQSFDHRIDHDEAASASYAGAAVHHNGSSLDWIHDFHATQKLQKWSRMIRHSMIWPRCELQLFNLTSLTIHTLYRKWHHWSNRKQFFYNLIFNLPIHWSKRLNILS